jgi:hypothetical protein
VAAGQGTEAATVLLGSTSGTVCVTYVLDQGCPASAPSCLGVSPITPQPGSQSFEYTGAVQSFVVPSCVTSIHIEAWGAQGGTPNANSSCGGNPDVGGLGGYAWGDLAVTPATAFDVYAGGAGQPGSTGGFNGGGLGCAVVDTCSTGGGASDVRPAGTSFDGRVIVAGGGGGAEYSCGGQGGGAGGGLIGGNGTGGDDAASDAQGGTQAAGGAGGVGSGGSGSPGAFGLGGAGSTLYHSGAGGGGWYGGGGGGVDGHGGGGSSYLGGVSGVTGTNPGQRSGNGRVVISW